MRDMRKDLLSRRTNSTLPAFWKLNSTSRGKLSYRENYGVGRSGCSLATLYKKFCAKWNKDEAELDGDRGKGKSIGVDGDREVEEGCEGGTDKLSPTPVCARIQDEAEQTLELWIFCSTANSQTKKVISPNPFVPQSPSCYRYWFMAESPKTGHV